MLTSLLERILTTYPGIDGELFSSTNQETLRSRILVKKPKVRLGALLLLIVLQLPLTTTQLVGLVFY